MLPIRSSEKNQWHILEWFGRRPGRPRYNQGEHSLDQAAVHKALAFRDVINLPADRLVAFAGSRLEPRPVHDLDLPAMVADETGLLQHIGDHGHGGTAHTEHLRQEFVGERDRVAVE